MTTTTKLNFIKNSLESLDLISWGTQTAFKQECWKKYFGEIVNKF